MQTKLRTYTNKGMLVCYTSFSLFSLIWRIIEYAIRHSSSCRWLHIIRTK